MLGQKSVVRGLNSERLDGLGKGLVCSGRTILEGRLALCSWGEWRPPGNCAAVGETEEVACLALHFL